VSSILNFTNSNSKILRHIKASPTIWTRRQTKTIGIAKRRNQLFTDDALLSVKRRDYSRSFTSSIALHVSVSNDHQLNVSNERKEENETDYRKLVTLCCELQKHNDLYYNNFAVGLGATRTLENEMISDNKFGALCY